MECPEVLDYGIDTDFSNELENLKDDIATNENTESDQYDEIKNKLNNLGNYAGITIDTIDEYLNIIKKSSDISDLLDENLKKDLGIDCIASEIDIMMGSILFYVKKLCPNKSEDILPLVYNMLRYSSENTITDYNLIKVFIGSIESYGDSVYEYLNFCSPFEGSYIKEGVSHMHDKNFGETLVQRKQRYEKEKTEDEPNIEEKIKKLQYGEGMQSMMSHYLENFVENPESLNLFSFLKDNPQRLENLGGKEIQSINLSLDSGINFAFRGIIEMVKSRPDINFPHLKDNASESEKAEWEKERTKIIKEYESLLRNYIARDKIDSGDKEKSFDKIFFTSSQGRQPLARKDSDFMPSKEWAQQFSGNEILDYSDDDERYKRGETDGIKMVSDIENYAHNHPNEKILVCINQHGNPDGSSGNGWTKENWIRLANISPNIKIRSIRCFFGYAFSNKDIYNQQSSVSGFSNHTVTSTSIAEIITESSNKNLGFHEMEIYTRLNYPISVTPLTESMDYMNRNTGEIEIGKVGLAQNDNHNNTSSISYA